MSDLNNKNDILDEALVSIVVITYNSSKYVLETLESAKEQTYKNIELIITDDYSTDDTVDICNKWIEKNKDRFVRTKIITSTKNLGISPNCNRGAKESQGEWIKMIAGDDVLENDIIEKYQIYVNKNKDVSILYSNVREYNDDFKKENLLPIKKINELTFNQNDSGSDEQFDILLKSNCVWTSTIMIKKSLLKKVNWFNEKYPFFEDRPLLLSILKAGYKIYYLDFFGAKYRRHSESVQLNNKEFLSKFREDKQRYFINECLEYFTPKEQKKMKYNYKKNLFLKKLFNNKLNVFLRILNRLL